MYDKWMRGMFGEIGGQLAAIGLADGVTDFREGLRSGQQIRRGEYVLRWYDSGNGGIRLDVLTSKGAHLPIVMRCAPADRGHVLWVCRIEFWIPSHFLFFIRHSDTDGMSSTTDQATGLEWVQELGQAFLALAH